MSLLRHRQTPQAERRHCHHHYQRPAWGTGHRRPSRQPLTSKSSTLGLPHAQPPELLRLARLPSITSPPTATTAAPFSKSAQSNGSNKRQPYPWAALTCESTLPAPVSSWKVAAWNLTPLKSLHNQLAMASQNQTTTGPAGARSCLVSGGKDSNSHPGWWPCWHGRPNLQGAFADTAMSTE